MADKTNETLNQLLSGQKQLKTDVSELKKGQQILKADVSELKEGQKRLELLLLNMENRIVPIINATLESTKMSKEQIELLQKTQNKHGDKLENHELRILKLEHSKH